MKVEVVSYDENWPKLFELEKDILLGKIGHIILAVHHIGSTSIEGLSAKPIIDIILAVGSLNQLDESKRKFEALDYEVMGEYGISRRRYYRKGRYNRTHQIHAYQAGDHHIHRHLAFRDYIKAHPYVKKEYENLKVKIASECENDIERYCYGKDKFVKFYEAKALEWAKGI